MSPQGRPILWLSQRGVCVNRQLTTLGVNSTDKADEFKLVPFERHAVILFRFRVVVAKSYFLQGPNACEGCDGKLLLLRERQQLSDDFVTFTEEENVSALSVLTHEMAFHGNSA
jgi:hypothetical protein